MEIEMTEEDEAFNDIERQARQRKESVRAAMRSVEDDDDIQIYQRPWVGLTVQEIEAIGKPFEEKDRSIQNWGIFACAIEAKLKEKNT
jgi:hypothetical protein